MPARGAGASANAGAVRSAHEHHHLPHLSMSLRDKQTFDTSWGRSAPPDSDPRAYLGKVAVRPPSTGMVAPWMWVASSPARNDTTAATSAGSDIRRDGTPLTRPSS